MLLILADPELEPDPDPQHSLGKLKYTIGTPSTGTKVYNNR